LILARISNKLGGERSYRYEGGHWNSYGNQIATESIYNYLTTNPVLQIEPNLRESE